MGSSPRPLFQGITLFTFVFLCGAVFAQYDDPTSERHRGGGIHVWDGSNSKINELPDDLLGAARDANPDKKPKTSTPKTGSVSRPPNSQTPTRIPGPGTKPPGNRAQRTAVPPRVTTVPNSSAPAGKTAEEEAVEALLTFVGGAGFTGAAAYALLKGLGLIGAKGVTAAGTAAAAEMAKAQAAEADAAAAAEVAPKVGDTRTYVDSYGDRWVEVFNGQNWVDSATAQAQQQQQAANRDWQEEQAARQVNHDTAFDSDLQRHQEILKKDLQQIREDVRQEHMESVEEIQKINERSLERAKSDQAWAETKTDIAEGIKDAADLGVAAVGSFTGPVGWGIGNAYTMASEMAGGVSESVVGGSGSVLDGAIDGMKTGLCKVAVGEALNAGGSLVSYGTRTVLGKIPLRNPGSLAPEVLFHEPLPVSGLKRMAENLGSGKAVMEGVETGLANMEVGAFREAVSGKGTSALNGGLRESALSTGKQALAQGMSSAARSGDAWGAIQGLKSVLIDDPLGQSLADTLFNS